MDAYSWEFGDGAVSSEKDTSHLYSAPSIYAVNLTVTKDSCSTICRGSVTVKPVPDCSWRSSSPVCDGTAVQFTGPAGMDSYLWDLGDGAVSSAPDPSHLYSAPGTYTVSLTVAKGGCAKTCTGQATVKPLPECDWTSSSPVYDGVPVAFSGPAGMDAYQWDFGDGSGSRAENPSHVYSSSGTYAAELTVTKGGCSKPSQGTVIVLPSTKPPVQYGQFYEAQNISGTGVVDVSTSILDKSIALEFNSAMAGEGDIELDSEHAYTQNADLLKRNLSAVNGSNESTLNLYGSTKLAYSGAEPLVGGERLHSRELYGGMGASVQEIFAAREIEREQTAFFAQTLPYRPLNNSAETLPGELERAGRDTARVDQLMHSREGVYNPSQLVGIEAKAAFNGTWGTDARWHRMFYKDIAAHEMFTGKFEAEKLLKFHRYPVPERWHVPCEGIDC
jgi:PKD repeat protein